MSATLTTASCIKLDVGRRWRSGVEEQARRAWKKMTALGSRSGRDRTRTSACPTNEAHRWRAVTAKAQTLSRDFHVTSSYRRRVAIPQLRNQLQPPSDNSRRGTANMCKLSASTPLPRLRCACGAGVQLRIVIARLYRNMRNS